MIGSERHPSELAVISNDTRIQQAAGRHGCLAWTCQRYLDWLVDSETRVPDAAPIEEEPEKLEDATEAEMAEWLRVFEEPKKRTGKQKRK